MIVANLNNLDVLRAVAVLCVIVTHLFSNVLGVGNGWTITLGRFGVFSFFVHTSLVLMMSLDRSQSYRLALDFYIRRAFRIYPLSVFVVLLVVALQIPYAPDRQYAVTDLGLLVQNLLLVQNFTSGFSSILGPLWTLPYEVQMYIALPFLHVTLRRRSPIAVIVLWGLSIAARAVPLVLGWNLTLIHFVPCFLGGVFAWRARASYRPFLPASAWPVALASIFVLYGWLHGRREIPMLDYAMCLTLGAATACFKDMRTSRFTQLCGTVAKYSYGSYLFHMPIMWVSFFVLPVARPLQWAIFAGLSIAVPWAAYRWIEKPMMDLGKRVAARISEPAPLQVAASA